MNIAVAGLWHLGCVIAAGLAKAGHRVVGYDPDDGVVSHLKEGKAPLFEPGLDDAIAEGVRRGVLDFTSVGVTAMEYAEVLWVAYDTPVSEDDRADTGYVEKQVMGLLVHAPDGLLVLISSQMPVGSAARLESLAAERFPDKNIRFAVSPENLRLGQALGYFLKPDRVVVGIRNETDQRQLKEVFRLIDAPIEWMSVESAEMAKHAINAFLALSVTFANELAVLCEKTGADARQVERALKTESRIGPKAYVRPGSAFAGGTLARDVVFLSELAQREQASISLIPAIQSSNETHKQWIYRTVAEITGDKPGAAIAVLGLTYKPGTDTLRRSTSVEFCRWAVERGLSVRAHDPAVKALPTDLASKVVLSSTPEEACADAAVVVIGTPWPDYKQLRGEDVAALAPGSVIIDANRFIIDAWPRNPGLNFRAVGLADHGVHKRLGHAVW